MRIIATYSVYSKTEQLPDNITANEALEKWDTYAPVDLDPESAEIRTVHVLDDEGNQIAELIL